MDSGEKILGFLRMNGPSLPSKVAKYLGTDILLASAMLSDLSSQGKVKISFLKIGGSPLYYLPGQEEKLYPFAEGNLNPKDFIVLANLKERNVVREADADLLTKVSLRSLKDFAVPLNVTVQGKTELFWKWRLLSEGETKAAVARIISPSSPAVSAQIKAPHDVKNDLQESASLLNTSPGFLSEALPEPVPAVSSTSPHLKTSFSSSPTTHLKFQSSLASVVTPNTNDVKDIPKDLSRYTLEEASKVVVENSAEEKGGRETTVRKKLFLQKIKEKVQRHKEDSFSPQIENLCRKLKITVDQKETIRKNAEIDMIVAVPSVVGSMKYFCKAKNKTKCDEKDLSSAYMEAQIKKLPLLFLYTTELSKKAQEMLDSGAFENAIIRKVE